jgi:predicted O-linked N-acetylglucosamine transferase (SPINDLY family)
MGVPMLTLEGDAVLARSGASLLGALGLQEWVAGSIDDYVASAIRLAGNRHALAQLRSGLRARLAASPLCDAAGFTRSLESAYRDMWQAWCRNP